MSTAGEQPTATRHAVVLVTTIAAILLYLDRFCISFAERFIKADLKLTDEQMSWVLSAFFWTYALGQVKSGWLADRHGARAMLTIYILSWSLFTGLTGLAGGFISLLACRFAFGLAQAGAYPTSAGLLSKWVPFDSRGMASSIVAFGGRVGGWLAPVLTGYLIVRYDWRIAIIVFGFGGIAVAAAFWKVSRDRPLEHPACNEAERELIGAGRGPGAGPHGDVRGVPWQAMLEGRSLWLNCLMQWGTNVGWVFLVTWLPRYLDEVHEVPVEQRKWMVGMPILAGWFGMLCGGWLTDRMVLLLGLRWGRSLLVVVSRLVGMLAYLVCMLPLSPWTVTAAFCVVALATDLGIGAVWAFQQDVGGRHVGSVLGWGNMWGNFGAALSPLLLNWLVKESGWGWSAAFLACATAFLISGLAAIGIDATKPIHAERLRPRLPLRLWCFRGLALAFPVLLLVVVEGALRLFNCGNDVRLVIKVPGNPERGPYQFNELADQPLYGVIPLNGPEPRRFELPKPDDTYRIVVVGGSTVAGFPYAPELAFPRHLELALGRQMTDKRVEVLNAGVTAITTWGVAELARQAADAQPDLIIVHSGHNDFYGPGGVASTAGAISPAMYPLVTWARSLRLYQVSVGKFTAKPTGEELMESLPRNLQIPLDSPEFKTAERCFRSSLERIVRDASRARVPVLLTTVAGNLRDQSPFVSLTRDDLAPAERDHWQQLFDQAMRHAIRGDNEQALDLFGQAEAIERTALLSYRKAQCLESLERWTDARRAFELARDLDGCRFRAPGSFREIARDVVEKASRPNVFFLDTAEALDELSGERSVGYNFFLEHVHHNFEGNWQTALALAETIQTTILGREWDAANVPTRQVRDESLGVVPEDHLIAHLYVSHQLTREPSKSAADNSRNRSHIELQIKELMSRLAPEEQRMFLREFPLGAAFDQTLLLRLAAASMRLGMLDRATELLERAAARCPWSADTHFGLNLCLTQLGLHDRAARELQLALELDANREQVHRRLRDLGFE